MTVSIRTVLDAIITLMSDEEFAQLKAEASDLSVRTATYSLGTQAVSGEDLIDAVVRASSAREACWREIDSVMYEHISPADSMIINSLSINMLSRLIKDEKAILSSFFLNTNKPHLVPTHRAILNAATNQLGLCKALRDERTNKKRILREQKEKK